MTFHAVRRDNQLRGFELTPETEEESLPPWLISRVFQLKAGNFLVETKDGLFLTNKKEPSSFLKTTPMNSGY